MLQHGSLTRNILNAEVTKHKQIVFCLDYSKQFVAISLDILYIESNHEKHKAMNTHHYNEERSMERLVHQVEAMLAHGHLGFFEEEAYLAILDYYEQRMQHEKCLEVVNHALEQHRFSATLYIRKAQMLAELSQGSEALELLEHARLLDASEIDIYLTRAEVLLQLQRGDEALEQLQDILTTANSNDLEEICLLMASIYEEMEQHKEAFDYYYHVLRLNPTHETALNRIWMSIELAELYEESIKLHDWILSQDAYQFYAWYNLGLSYHRLGLYEKAYEAYDFAITINEDFEYAYRDAADVLFAMERYEEALVWYGRILTQFKADEEIWLSVGRCYERLEQFDEARKAYHRSLRLDLRNGQAFYRIGRCHMKENRWTPALSAFKRAFKIDAHNEDFCIALADAYYEVDDVEQASIHYKLATELAPYSTHAWMAFLEFLLDEEFYEALLELAEHAEQYTHDAGVDYARTVALFGLGMRKEGLEVLERAVARDPNFYDFVFDFLPELQQDAEVLRLLDAYLKREE